jgi:hypothetical protein
MIWGIAYLWFVIGGLVAGCANNNFDKPFRTAVGIGLLWPLMLIVFLIRAAVDAIEDALGEKWS